MLGAYLQKEYSMQHHGRCVDRAPLRPRAERRMGSMRGTTLHTSCFQTGSHVLPHHITVGIM